MEPDLGSCADNHASWLHPGSSTITVLDYCDDCLCYSCNYCPYDYYHYPQVWTEALTPSFILKVSWDALSIFRVQSSDMTYPKCSMGPFSPQHFLLFSRRRARSSRCHQDKDIISISITGARQLVSAFIIHPLSSPARFADVDALAGRQSKTGFLEPQSRLE